MTRTTAGTRLALSLSLALSLAGCGDNLSHPPARNPYAAGDAGLSCVPNLDGQIDASELSPLLGAAVTYLVSPAGESRAVNLRGSTDAQGLPSWDFSTDDATDQAAMLEAVALGGQWFAGSFPAGKIVTPIDAAGQTLGVYTEDAETFSLLGIASAKESPPDGKTLLVYDAPVALYRFPLHPGASWVSVGHVVNGMIHGLPYAGTDTYAVSDDALGELALHDLTFTQVHRLRTNTTVAPSAGAPTSVRQVQFLFECFGEVVRATSHNDEPNVNFTSAAELRRLNN